MDVLQVVRDLRDLTIDPKNRATIVRDQGCLPGLVVFLDNRNPEVMATALEALNNLAEVHSNRGLMKSEVGLIISLRNIMRRPSEYDPRIVQLAQSVHNLLIPPSGTNTRPLTQSRVPSSGNTFLGASNRKAKTVILQIQGLNNQETRSVIEGQLLSIKGIISFTTDLSRQRCTVRLRSDLKAQTVCEAINSSGVLTAQQVVKNEIGEEILLSFGEGSSVEKENNSPVKLPDYLPEDDEVKTLDDDRALEKSGAVDGAGGGWFSSVTGMIGKAFYW